MSTVLDVTGRVRPRGATSGTPGDDVPVDGAPASHHDVVDDAIAQAAQAVGRGGLVVVPTDTVYGIGADAFDAAAVAELLAAKGRGRESPPPVLVPAKRTLDGLATQVPDYARRLVERFWPGPLTIVVRAQASLRWDLGETNGTVAVRMPDDPVTLRLLERTGPLAVSSANRHGEPAATTAQEAQDQLGEAVDVYLDAGPVTGGAASTIVDCTKDEPVIVRHGALTDDEVLTVARGDEPEAPGEGALDQAGEPDSASTESAEPIESPEPIESTERADSTDATDAAGGDVTSADTARPS